MGYTFKENISSNFVQSVVVTLIIWALLWYGPHVSDTITHYTKLGESFFTFKIHAQDREQKLNTPCKVLESNPQHANDMLALSTTKLRGFSYNAIT